MTYALSAGRLGAQIGAQNAVAEETRVSREDLYENVWTEPVRTETFDSGHFSGCDQGNTTDRGTPEAP